MAVHIAVAHVAVVALTVEAVHIVADHVAVVAHMAAVHVVAEAVAVAADKHRKFIAPEYRVS